MPRRARGHNTERALAIRRCYAPAGAEEAVPARETQICPLCTATEPAFTFAAGGRRFYRCGACDLLFVPPEDRPTRAAELEHYETHENDPADPRYREFLGRLADPLIERLAPGSVGLDFGCGPGPTLSGMLAEAGFPTAIYDPLFAPDAAALERRYDFVTCTETVEHFHDPGAELARLDALVRPGGWLAIMTELVDARLSPSWWYLRDPTHVCFYSRATLAWIAGRFRWDLERPGRSVALYQKRV